MNHKHKVLVIEDELSISKFIKLVLQKQDFEVIQAFSGEDGIKKVTTENPVVVILDIMLPGIDGFKVCEILRKNHPKVGIIMLTALGQDVDKIKGLEYGADDYMIKPFNPLELAARVTSLIRRMSFSNDNSSRILISEPFKVDLNSKIAYKNEEKLNLTPKEFLLLKIFIENIGISLSRDKLLDLAWGYNFVGDPKIVDVNIRRLRSKLEDDPSYPKYLQTVWGTGYIWKEV
ncbi:regulator [Clostridium sp. K25]|uniref:Stage 0 sporulation protein A homolog n=1 Tax=Clostridium botulinum D str. 1873 TaxID=592027 RepID=A0A9P2LM91_CLOBO|nr:MULTISPECIES: response regulator transcription factor [Clostridium]EES92186.1 alkaline phosphatase synthesis transcriptional regulatory protein PhoP [Clostridium botulinum D str. 1873]KEI08333.1 regulator [Clostridium sp. K25]MBO3442403.1 response regulator transcription factor [Clostridium haemolyticum]MCD3216818.1 response regulator transcription factor [Clostridium botulinum C]MCD3245630.1 response regulator transcription factor [Clostridium botulinum C]